MLCGGIVFTSLHQMKADLFKALGNPMRVQILELLCGRERAVAEMLSEIGAEASALSQQLAVLRGAGLVAGRREGSTVFYTVTSPRMADLLAVARRLQTELLDQQMELLSGLRAEEVDSGQVATTPQVRRQISQEPSS